MWETAGTAHADEYLVGKGFALCAGGINDGPQHYIVNAGLAALLRWVDGGAPPPQGDQIEIEGTTVQRDELGLALGGIRTPPVDVPVSTLTGAPGPNPSTICLLLGSSKPFSAARLGELYSSRAEYLEKYEADTDATIKAGFALREDRAALLEFAEPTRMPE